MVLGVTFSTSSPALSAYTRPTCIATNVARSVVCVSVCMLGTQVSFAKTAETIEMLFRGLTHVGLRKHVLDGNPDLLLKGSKRDTFVGDI